MNTTWLILGIGFALLATRRFRPDFVVIATAIALQLSGALSLEQTLAGFSNPAVLTMAAFMILSYSARGIELSRYWESFLRWRASSAGSISFWSMWGSGLLGSIMQDELAIGTLMPGTIRAGRKHGIPPSKLLMPLAYGALLGRTMWLVGSPAALLLVWAMSDQGMTAFGVFDFALISVIFLLFGSLYVGFLGHTVLPRKRAEADPLDRFRIRQRLREFIIRVDSPMIGRSLGEMNWGKGVDPIILGIKRVNEPTFAPTAQLQMVHGDILVAQVDPEQVKQISDEMGLESVPNVDLNQDDITRGDIELVEVVVRLESSLQGQSLRQVDFRRRYGLSVLAIARGTQVLVDHLGDTLLQGGDVLLIQGDRRRVDLMLPEVKAIPLGERAIEQTTKERSWWALGGVVVALGLAASGWLSTLAAFLLMALVMSVLSRFPTRDAYRTLDWPLLVLLAGVIPWATAMETSGLTKVLVDSLLSVWVEPNPYMLLMALYLLVVGLVTVMNAPIVAVLIPPVAMGIAVKLGVSAEPFLMVTALAASAVFLWPVGHRTHVLVQSTGGYIASDYPKMGIWLIVLLGLLNLLIVPAFWPF